MMKKFYIIISLATLCCSAVFAQAPRSSYHIEGIPTSHELNPSFQPDSNYLAIPILGNTQFTWQSSMKLGDLIYDRNDGKLTTFMSEGTISKSDLMDKVGNGLKNNVDIRLSLFNMGKRINATTYRTYGLSFRVNTNIRAPKDLFRLLKDVENGSYDLKNLGFRAISYLEASVGQSMKIDDKLTVGGKVKLLAGIASADVKVNQLNVNVPNSGNWTVNADVISNIYGFDYKTKTEEYKSRMQTDGVTSQTYEQVNSIKTDGLGIKGLGIAIDAGANYKYDDNWTFSAAVLDLGFISWFGGHKAQNVDKSFEFQGFQNIAVEKSNENSLKNQWDRLEDDLMDMAHLERSGNGGSTRMLGCTLEGAASYKYDYWNFGGLLTANINGIYSWCEARINVDFSKYKNFDIVLSPAYSTFGTCLGGTISYHTDTWSAYIASDNIFTKFTKQFIPTANSTSIQFGVAKTL